MSIIPITLPPGMFLNSTPYGGKGRWGMGNRVRWHDGSLRPIGGWDRRTLVADDALMPSLVPDPAVETIRDLHFWNDQQGDTFGAAGSHRTVYYINSNNESRALVIPGYTPGGNQPVLVNGYGIAAYGRSTYGTPRSSSGARGEPAARWVFDNWGRDLLHMSVQRGPIYRFVTGAATQPTVMSANAPTDNGGFIVTDQRIVMVIDPGGATGEEREVRWSDSEDFTVWTPDITNQAGFQLLTGNGQLLSIHKVLGQIMITSETDVHIARYLGPPFVYGFNRVGHSCGPISRQVVATTDRFAMWLGDRQFWKYDGTVTAVACDVMDFLVTDMDPDWLSASVVHTVAAFNEIWWHYKSKNSATGDVDAYVAHNYQTGAWSVGKLDRTAAVDRDVTRDPIYVDAAGFVYNHEIALNGVEGAYAETGPLELLGGEVNTAVQAIYPDTQSVGSALYTLRGRQMPTAPDLTFGPYPFANPVMTRAFGREIRLVITGTNLLWEVGPTTRFLVADSGTGRR